MLVSDISTNYNLKNPKRPQLQYSYGWIVGTFCIGNDYRNKTTFHGAYPHGLLKRYDDMFNLPEHTELKILHLFSGSIPPGPYVRSDIKTECDVQCKAEEISKYFDNYFDIIFADPPYTKKDADIYGTGMPNKAKVFHEMYKIAKPEGIVVWLDERRPMYRKTEWKMVGGIGVVRSTNHRIRMIQLFQRQ